MRVASWQEYDSTSENHVTRLGAFASVNSWIKVWILGATTWITLSGITNFHFHPLGWECFSSNELIVTPLLLKAKCNLGVPFLICVFISWLLVVLFCTQDTAKTHRKRVRKNLCGADSSAIYRAISIMVVIALWMVLPYALNYQQWAAPHVYLFFM